MADDIETLYNEIKGNKSAVSSTSDVEALYNEIVCTGKLAPACLRSVQG